MTDVLNPTDNGLPDENRVQGRNFRYIPPPPTQELRDAKMQADHMSATREAQHVEQRTLDEFNPHEPVPYNGSNWHIQPAAPNLPEMPSDVDQANELMEQVRQSVAARASNTSFIGNVGSILTNLESVEGQGYAMVGEHAPGQADYSDSIQNAWANRALQTQNLTVAPGITNGLAGVTRAYHDGLPFNNAVNQSARDWLRRNAGVDIGGIESPREEVRPPNFFDRALGAAQRAGRNIALGPISAIAERVPFVRGVMDNLTPFSRGSDVAAARRIVGEAARIVGDRSSERIDAVGLPRFLAENTIDRLNPARSDSLGRALLRNANPVTLIPRAFRQGTGLTWEDGGVRHGWDTPTEFRSRLPSFSNENFNFGGIPLAAPAVPGDIAGGDQGFWGELGQRSPEFRNLMRAMEPAVNEAGIVGFAPQHGQFGDFGSAGALSGLLWLANLPEGILTGALYDTIDLGRYLTRDTAIGRLLGPPSPTAARPDILSPLYGRDLGFNQQWSEEKYLSVRGNPALSWMPSLGQTYLGFILDMATGFAADAVITEPIWNLATGARRRAAQTAASGIPNPRARGVAEQSAAAVDLPNFSSAVDAQAFANALDVRIARAKQRMSANMDDLDFVQRMGASINVMERQRDAIRNLDFSSVASVVQTATAATPAPRGGPRLGTPNDIANALTRQPLNAADISSVNRLARSVDLARRGGTAVTDAVRSLRRMGVVASNIAPSAALMTNTPISFVPVREATKWQAAVSIAEVSPPALVPRSAVFDRISTIQRQVNDIQTQIASAVEENIRVPLQTSVTNLVAEQKALSSLLDQEEYSLFVTDLITRADGQTISVAPAGYLLENAPDEILDSILPRVNLSLVTPRSTDSVPESIVTLPLRDVDISGTEFIRTRRSDESLSQLAQLWGLDGPMGIPSDARSELANVYRMEALARQYPNLLSRYGSPIPSFLLDTPGARIITTDAGIMGEPAESVVSDIQRQVPVALTEPSSGENRRARTVLNQLSRRGERTVRRISHLRDEFNEAPTDALRDSLEREHARLNALQAQMEETYARFPDLAIADIVRSLPDHIQPLGPRGLELAPSYALALRQFYVENGLLQRMHHELAVTDQLLRDQGEQMLLQPPLERVDPGSEFATTRQYDPEFNLHSVSEHDIPDSTLLMPEVRIPDGGLSARDLVREIVEQTGATESQAQTAIFNGVRVGQFTRVGRTFHQGTENMTLEQLFQRADEILPSNPNEPVSLSARREANRIAREAIEPAQNEAMGIPDLRTRERPEVAPPETPGEVIPMNPEGAPILAPARDDGIIDLNIERIRRQAQESLGEEENQVVQAIMERLQPMLDEMPEEVSGPLIQRASDILSQSTPEEAGPALMELLQETMGGASGEMEQAGQGLEELGSSIEEVRGGMDELMESATDTLREQGVDVDALLADDAPDPMADMFMEESRDFLYDEPTDIVMGTDPNGRRVFGLRDSSGNIISGAGGERRIEPLDVEVVRVNEIEPDTTTPKPEATTTDIAARDADTSNRTVTRDGFNFEIFHEDGVWNIVPPGGDTVPTATSLAGALKVVEDFPLPARLPVQTVYHGTHADALLPDTRVMSLTNELGKGLYVTTNPNEAVLYARANTAQDAIIQGDVRPRFTNEGRVFEIVMPGDELTPAPKLIRRQESYDDIYGFPQSTNEFELNALNVVDANTLGVGVRGEGVGRVLQEAFRDAIETVLKGDEGRTIWRRFQSWSKKHPYREWHQYLRSQIIKEMGPDTQAIQFRTFESVQGELMARNVDAIRDGSTLNLVNDLSFYTDRSLPDRAATGSLAEQLAARVEIQKLTFSRNPTKTNEVAMQQAFHDLNTFQREQLAGAVQQQERIAVEAVRELMSREDVMLELRRSDEADSIARRQSAMEERITREADALDEDLGPCP